MKPIRTILLSLAGAAYLAIAISACREESEALLSGDLTMLGGASATIAGDLSFNAFGHALPGMNSDEKTRFVLGNSFFRDNWVTAPASTTARDGLGAVFNMSSCGGCHTFDGRGKPPEPGEPITSLLIRLSIPGTTPHGEPLPDPVYGGQLNNQAIQGVKPEGSMSISYKEIKGRYADGESYSLRQPLYEFVGLNYGSLHGSIMFSPRVAPQMPGLGLLEAVDAQTILSLADPDDSNRDGISGRANYVWDEEHNRSVIGRFGWKANQPSLRQQVAGAFSGDMGITSALFPAENLSADQQNLFGKLPNGGSPEVSNKILDAVTYYSATLAVAAQRDGQHSEVLKGREMFVKANCNTCHVMTMTTGQHPTIPQVSGQVIHPFTDLLLHDMGAALADNRPDFVATGSEWRTPPLWGIGLIRTVNKHTFLLHDGRARSIEEAILWHGGEAEKSKTTFVNMSKADRLALLKFLNSL